MAQELTTRQIKFIQEYLIDENATSAAGRAGYSLHSARTIAQQLLRLPQIKEEIETRKKDAYRKMGISVERVLQELAMVAFSNPQDFVTEDDDGKRTINLRNLKKEHAAALSEYSMEIQDGKVLEKFKTKSEAKLKALDMIGTFLGMKKEVVEHNVNLSLEQLVQNSMKIENKVDEKEVIEGDFIEVNQVSQQLEEDSLEVVDATAN